MSDDLDEKDLEQKEKSAPKKKGSRKPSNKTSKSAPKKTKEKVKKEKTAFPLVELETNPEELFVFPLTKRPLFPGMAAPLVIETGPYYEVLKAVAKSKHKQLGLFLTKRESQDIFHLKVEDLHTTGVSARVLRIIPLDQGGAQVVLSIEKRIKAKKLYKNKQEAMVVKPEFYHDPPVDIQSEMVKAYSVSIINTIKDLLKLNPLFKEELQIFLGHSDFTEPGKLADFAVTLTTASREDLQDILEAFEVTKRIDKALALLKKELDLSKLQSSINQKIEASVSQSQREFFLKEQLKTIKRELGLEKDDKTCDAEKYQERLSKLIVPAEVMEVINEELDKLSVLDVQSAEYTVCRNYLDWLTVIPWGLKSEDASDLKKAKQILEEDHYGLKDVKERIVEFMSVGKLNNGLKGSIICLSGPPGVGKTSVGKSIAKALGREFYRFSVGGMRDEAEIKGHRRTYVGAMPGKLIQALKTCKTMNPVIMLDEVDKMGQSYQGDPASALLEVLDPEQNKDFLDHYLDVRCDLSDVLFIVTANVLEKIPSALKDRMESLKLSGYIMQEKVEIAHRYLIPKHRKAMGLKQKDVKFSKAGIKQIANSYCREAGVRSLENNIKKILRKVATRIVEEKEAEKPTTSFSLSEDNIEDFLGKPIFSTERYYAKTPVGVCMGLAWTSLGGTPLYVEAVKTPADKAAMKLTGQAGDVMKESSQIAWTFLHSRASEYAPKTPYFNKSEVHIHIPEGATPKDGPSAGVTMTTALLSLLKGIPVRENLSMTGELTLTGKVLPIGGVKEKLIAARRAGVKVIIFPEENRSDYEELPGYLKKGVKPAFVSHYDEVVNIAFNQSKKKPSLKQKKTTSKTKARKGAHGNKAKN